MSPGRNTAVDAYRGFVMLLMMAEVLRLSAVARAIPGNWFWGVLGYHQSHVPWAGCSLHDMIQPSFSFLVGVALPYSIAAYFLADYFGRLIADAFRIHLGTVIFQVFGTGLEPLTRGMLQLLTYWLILYWMYRRKIFLRI